MIKKRTIFIFNVILCFCMLISCTKTETVDEKENEIILNEGAMVKFKDNSYSNLNLVNDKYAEVINNSVISTYNKVSGTYVYLKDGKTIIKYKSKDIEILDENIIDIKVSQDGEYISYFKMDDYYNLKILNLKQNKEEVVDISTAISGNILEWLDGDTIVYYGIDSKNNNAIFTYNLKDKTEKLIYKLQKGYVEFIKVTESGVIILQNINGNKILKNIKDNTEILSTDILQVKDLLITKQGTYFLGNIKDRGYSLYNIQDGKASRVVYDFPNIIDMDKGLSCTEQGDIMFVGADSDIKKSNIYILKNGYVKLLTNSESEYYFIDIN